MQHGNKPHLLTKEQAHILIEAIDMNFEWAHEKGHAITDVRRFIETIILHHAPQANIDGANQDE